MTTREIVRELDGFDVEHTNRRLVMWAKYRIRATLTFCYLYFNPVLYKKIIL